MDEITIFKLLGSESEDDVILGTEYLYKLYKGNEYRLRKRLYKFTSKVRLDIYIGNVNIVFWGKESLNTSVYGANTDTTSDMRIVRL